MRCRVLSRAQAGQSALMVAGQGWVWSLTANWPGGQVGLLCNEGEGIRVDCSDGVEASDGFVGERTLELGLQRRRKHFSKSRESNTSGSWSTRRRCLRWIGCSRMTGPPGTCSPKIALDPRLRASLRSSRRQCSSKAVLQLGLAKSPLNRAARRLSPQVRAWSTLSLLPSISWTSRIGLRQHARRKEGNQ